MLPVGLVSPWPDRVVTSITRLVLSAVLGRRRAGYHLDGLNGVGRKLVGEHLALLIGDRLTVHGKRIGCVIAKTMKEAVGVGGDAGRRERDQRTERGRLAFEGQLLDQIAVDVGVQGGVILYQVVSRDRHRGRGPTHLQLDDRSNGDGGAHRHIGSERAKPGASATR